MLDEVLPLAQPVRLVGGGHFLQQPIDVRDLARVGDESAFVRFVRAAAARTGQLLNLSELARDADEGISAVLEKRPPSWEDR